MTAVRGRKNVLVKERSIEKVVPSHFSPIRATNPPSLGVPGCKTRRRHVKINGSPVSLTENSAIFRKTDFLKKSRIFKNPLIVLPFFVKSHFLW